MSGIVPANATLNQGNWRTVAGSASSGGTSALLTPSVPQVGVPMVATLPAGVIGTLQFYRVSSVGVKTLLGSAVTGVNTASYTPVIGDITYQIGCDASATVASTTGAVLAASPPGAPTGLTLTGITNAIQLAYAAPANNGGAAVLDYLFTDSNGASTVVTTNPQNITYPVGTSVTGTLVARNSTGFGAPSNSASATPVSASATPNPPTVSSVAAAGAGASDVTLASGGGAAAAAYRAVAYKAGQVDTTVTDETPAGTLTPLVRRMKGMIPGTAYTFGGIATSSGGTDSAVGTLSGSLTLPIYSTSKPLTDTGYLWYNPGVVTSALNNALAAVTTSHIQFTVPGHIKDIEIWHGNSSLTNTAVVKMSIAVAATAGAIGSVVTGGTSTIPSTRNASTWIDGPNGQITIPVAPPGATGLGEDGMSWGSFGKITLATPDRTDYAGAPPVLDMRIEFANGSSYTVGNHLANNAATSGQTDVEFGKENPAVSQHKGAVLRCFNQAIGGVTDKTLFTSAASYRNSTFPVFFAKFTYRDGAIGFLPIIVGDSREQATQMVTHSSCGPATLAVTQNSTLARPISLVNIGGGGFSPDRWLKRSQVLIGLVGMTNANTAFVPTSSINGFGNAGVISNFTTLADSADATASAWAATGARIVRSTIPGVDYIATEPTYKGSYNWGTQDVTVREGDNGIGVARTTRSNLWYEEAATAAAPIIPMGSLLQGRFKNPTGQWYQADKITNESWIVFNATTPVNEPTRAHFTNNAALRFMPQYTPFMLTN